MKLFKASACEWKEEDESEGESFGLLLDDEGEEDSLHAAIHSIQSPTFKLQPEHMQQEMLIKLRQRRKEFTDPAIYNPQIISFPIFIFLKARLA